jgi:hypothetical protein
MPSSHYVGKAGHLATMGELCLRGYNVAMPEIDKGDDVFVVRDDSGAMWRLQVKTSRGKKQKTSRAFGFRVKELSIATPQTPDLHFIFVMRKSHHWRFLIMDRAVLRTYVRNNHVGTLNGDYRQVNIVLHDDGRAICSGIDLHGHLEDWATWPTI